MSERLQLGSLAGLALLLAGLAWWFGVFVRYEPDVAPLRSFPERMEAWSSEPIPIDPGIESMLGSDFSLQRAYRHRSGDLVWLYVGYYATRSGGRPEHTPRNCYRAQGWTIVGDESVAVGAGSDLRVNELVVRAGGGQRLVHFWYRSAERTGILGGLGLSWERLRRRLSSGRGDAALVRVSTPLEQESREAARARLLPFDLRVDRALAEHWPHERRSR